MVEQVKQLPATIEINNDILLSHGSPWDIDEYIYPVTDNRFTTPVKLSFSRGMEF